VVKIPYLSRGYIDQKRRGGEEAFIILENDVFCHCHRKPQRGTKGREEVEALSFAEEMKETPGDERYS
jgi:hypothetical protein